MPNKGVPMVEVCPECDHPGITARVTKTPRYRCDVCPARFDEPAVRASKQHKQSTENMPQTDRYDDIRAALRSLQRDGQTFVKSAHVADRVKGLDALDVGKVLATRGLDSGDVSKWRDNTPTLWRIRIEAAGEQEPEVPA